MMVGAIWVTKFVELLANLCFLKWSTVRSSSRSTEHRHAVRSEAASRHKSHILLGNLSTPSRVGGLLLDPVSELSVFSGGGYHTDRQLLGTAFCAWRTTVPVFLSQAKEIISVTWGNMIGRRWTTPNYTLAAKIPKFWKKLSSGPNPII